MRTSAVARRLLPVLLVVAVADVSAGDMDQALARCPGLAKSMEAIAVKQVQPEVSRAPALPELRQEILAMERADQAARARQTQSGNSTEAQQQVRQVDEQHLPRLKSIATAHGFPTAAQVGKDAVGAFWLLVQHADADPAFQEQMLSAVAPYAKSGEIDASKVALLTDRVLLAQGKAQRYGTQAKRENGKLRLLAVEDEPHLDERRREVGLMPVSDYLCMLEVLYEPVTQQ